MSKYTTQLRFICEQLSCLDESVDFSKIDLVIESAYYKIFDFDFPIFDEKYRKVLCTKILKHYYFKEIGFETYALWKNYLNTTLNEIMPYYNQLYESELLKFNPFYDVDLKRKHDTESDGKTETSNSSEHTSKYTEKYSDTPQGSITNLENGNYLTNATLTDTKGNEKADSNSNINSTEKYLEIVSGKMGTSSYSKMLKEYRTTFLNIDAEIINELNDLFMLLW